MIDTSFTTSKAGCSSFFDGDVYAQGLQWSGAFPQRSHVFISPNGNNAADSLASIYMHELFEAVTDAQGGGWFRDCDGQENGDLCQMQLGQVKTLPGGGNYNVQAGTHYFLVQAMYWNTEAVCTLQIMSNWTRPPSVNTDATKNTTSDTSVFGIYLYVLIIAGALVLCQCVWSTYRSMRPRQIIFDEPRPLHPLEVGVVQADARIVPSAPYRIHYAQAALV